jgi:phage replication O-like protein O
MANPQKENGYMPIANEIVEHLARLRINGESMQVLWVILRKTYGFNKKDDYIALSQFCTLTGLKKPTVCKALAKLVLLNVITQKDNGDGKTYMFVKDFDKWTPLPKKVTLPKKIMSITQKDNNRYPKRVLQKTITKDTITKDIALTSNAGQIPEVIALFEVINPSVGRLYGRVNQRSSADRLLKQHGIDKLRQVVSFISKYRGDRFFPTITTPLQLEDKWGALEAYALKLKVSLNKNKIVTV